MIKAALALERGKVPGTLHFDTPNPLLELDDAAFRLTAEAADWPDGGTPRRAAVSSFGIGGTNAHVILEAAPPEADAPTAAAAHCLRLSAATPDGLRRAADRLATAWRRHRNGRSPTSRIRCRPPGRTTRAGRSWSPSRATRRSTRWPRAGGRPPATRRPRAR